MDETESGGRYAGREQSKKRGAVSMDGERPSKVTWKRASSNTCRSEDISVPHRQVSEDVEAEVERLVEARDVSDGWASRSCGRIRERWHMYF